MVSRYNIGLSPTFCVDSKFFSLGENVVEDYAKHYLLSDNEGDNFLHNPKPYYFTREIRLKLGNNVFIPILPFSEKVELKSIISLLSGI